MQGAACPGARLEYIDECVVAEKTVEGFEFKG